MNKKSFKDIEQIIKNAAEAYEPAFDNKSWEKMETLLDKFRKRPFVFWIWLLLPILIGAAGISYFTFNNNDNKPVISIQKNNDQAKENANHNAAGVNKNIKEPAVVNSTNINGREENTTIETSINAPVTCKTKNSVRESIDKVLQSNGEYLFSKKILTDKVKGKINATITAAIPVDIVENNEDSADSNDSGFVIINSNESTKKEEVIVVKVDAGKADEKEIKKIIDSVIEKSGSDKKSKDKQYRFYIIASAGAEANGVKLFSADKITLRTGLAIGYQINKNISVQTGFFVSNKKYVAAGSDYQTKPGSYWNIVDLKSIEANCRVYEIPVTIRYDFTPGKKLNIFGTAGLSSYIMKKEDYHMYYDRYGSMHEADVSYSGNQNLFSVLKISAGVEKNLSKQFSLIAAPGLSIPLAGVGEGKVKLYSADIMIGLKFTPHRKKLKATF